MNILNKPVVNNKHEQIGCRFTVSLEIIELTMWVCYVGKIWFSTHIKF